jgi:hypothetical protein
MMLETSLNYCLIFSAFHHNKESEKGARERERQEDREKDDRKKQKRFLKAIDLISIICDSISIRRACCK